MESKSDQVEEYINSIHNFRNEEKSKDIQDYLVQGLVTTLKTDQRYKNKSNNELATFVRNKFENLLGEDLNNEIEQTKLKYVNERVNYWLKDYDKPDSEMKMEYIPQSKEARALQNSPPPDEDTLRRIRNSPFEPMNLDMNDLNISGGKRKRKRRKRKTKRKKRKTKKRKGGKYLACICKKKRRSTGVKKRSRKKTRRRKK